MEFTLYPPRGIPRGVSPEGIGSSSHFIVEKLAEIQIISIFESLTLNIAKYLNFIYFSKCYVTYVAKSLSLVREGLMTGPYGPFKIGQRNGDTPEFNSKVLLDIEMIRQGMNYKRTDFTLPDTHEFKITLY